jgi:hypothetical protein
MSLCFPCAEPLFTSRDKSRSPPSNVGQAFLSCSDGERNRDGWPGAESRARSALRRQGFTVGLLVGLVGTGYAVVKPETMVAAGKTFNVVRFVITDSGRQAIGS